MYLLEKLDKIKFPEWYSIISWGNYPGFLLESNVNEVKGYTAMSNEYGTLNE